jgi:AcrR family transcriptional regulator
LVRIAYKQIVEEGFEGLRVRDVAQEAGINHATLHYYFPTKEALIQGVVDALVEEFQTNRAPRSGEDRLPEEAGALAELRREIEDVRVRFHTMPDMFVVLAELFARSRRDPVMARIIAQMDAGWRGYLVSILERGVREGVFRPELDLDTTATAIMVQMKGIGYQMMGNPDGEQIDRLISEIAAQVERWIIA